MTWRPAGRKYGNTSVRVDGVFFASKREAARWQALNMMVRAKMIQNLQRQVAFDLNAYNEEKAAFVRVGRYFADFTYYENGAYVVEDAKGMKTELYRWKKKHLKAEYGIDIKEV
jgi:hypothetical protein